MYDPRRLPYTFEAHSTVSLVVPLVYWYVIGGIIMKYEPRRTSYDFDAGD